MKINIITSPFGPLPPNAIGAVERLWYYIGQEFKNKGNGVCFYSKADMDYANDVDVIPIKGYERTRSIYLDILLDFVYTLKVYIKMKPCDILIQNTFWSPILGKFFKRKYRRAVYNVARKPARHFRFYGAVDQFSCVSKSVQKDLNNYITDSNKGVTVSNPVNLQFFSYLKRKLPSNGLPIVVGYHGRVHPEKGLDILCRALQMLSGRFCLKLLVVGPFDIAKGGGGDGYVKYLKSLCPDVELCFTGPFSSPEKLNGLLHSCQLYCYPSVASGETFGVSPLEAMATGLPIVVSGLDCFKDFVEEGCTGLVFDHTAAFPEQCLASQLEKLIIDRELASSIGNAAYEKSQGFSVESIANQYLSNFETLLKD